MAGNTIDGNASPISNNGMQSGNSPTQPQGTPITNTAGTQGNSSDGRSPQITSPSTPGQATQNPIPSQSSSGGAASSPIPYSGSASQPQTPIMGWPTEGGNAIGTPSHPIVYTTPYTQDLLLTFQFAVELSGMVQGYFLECSGLGVETELIEHKLVTITGHSYVIAQPGRTKWNQLTLKRGITTSLDIWDWHRLVEQGKMKKARKNCTILMFKRDYTVAARWDLIRAWPIKVSGPETKSDSADYGLEEFVLAHEGMRRVKV